MRDLFMNFSLGARIGMIVGLIAAAAGAWAAISEGGLAGAILVVVLLAVLVGGFWIGLAPQARRNRLARVGVPAEATILSIAETGWTLNGNYGLARLRLQVEPPDGGDPYEVTVKSYINRFEIPSCQPGVRLPVAGRPGGPDQGSGGLSAYDGDHHPRTRRAGRAARREGSRPRAAAALPRRRGAR